MLDPSRKAHAKAGERLRDEPFAWLTTVRADRVDGYLAKYQTAIAALRSEPGPFAGTYSTPIRVLPTRVRVW